MERLRSALRCTIATVQQHITSADPNSPAALLAADLAFHSANRGDASRGLSETASGDQPRARGSSSTTSDGADGPEEPRVYPLPTTHMLRVGAGGSTASVVVAAAEGGLCERSGDGTLMVTEAAVAGGKSSCKWLRSSVRRRG